MKKEINGFLAGIIATTIIAVPVMSFAETTSTITAIFDRVKLVVNGEKVNSQTILYNGTTYVPIRAVSESLGADVTYDNATQEAKISFGGYEEDDYDYDDYDYDFADGDEGVG